MYSMKEQFIKFLEDNGCLNPWMDAVRNHGMRSVTNPTKFIAENIPSAWISGAFDWSASARDHYVDWHAIYVLWNEYLKTHTV